MNEEEKYKQIVSSRQNGADNPQGGVKSDPQDDNKPEVSEDKPEQGESAKTTDAPKEPTPEEKQQHAFAEMRFRYKRETDALKREIAELKKAVKAGEMAETPKSRSDFNSDEEYGRYIRSSMEDAVYKRVAEKFEASRDERASEAEEVEKLSKGLESVEKGLGQKVFAELKNPDSEMSQILLDERGGQAISDTIRSSPHGAEMLAILYGRPQVFREILELPPKRQEYRLFQLEDSIEMYQRQRAEKAKADEARKRQAESLPAAGTFGTNGNGNTDIGGMSTLQRVERYKADMRKRGII